MRWRTCSSSRGSPASVSRCSTTRLVLPSSVSPCTTVGRTSSGRSWRGSRARSLGVRIRPRVRHRTRHDPRRRRRQHRRRLDADDRRCPRSATRDRRGSAGRRRPGRRRVRARRRQVSRPTFGRPCRRRIERSVVPDPDRAVQAGPASRRSAASIRRCGSRWHDARRAHRDVSGAPAGGSRTRGRRGLRARPEPRDVEARCRGSPTRCARDHGARVVELRAARRPTRSAAANPRKARRRCSASASRSSTLGSSLAMLLTTAIGNDPSTSIAMRLVDIEVPPDFVAGFPGPRFGMAGWRRVTGVERPPAAPQHDQAVHRISARGRGAVRGGERARRRRPDQGRRAARRPDLRAGRRSRTRPTPRRWTGWPTRPGERRATSPT